MTDRLLGVVLCGGRSSRMGQDTSTLAWAGLTFAEHAIRRLAPICDHVCVAGDSSATVDVDVLSDPLPFQGPAVGVATALGFANEHEFNACLITPVDMPWLTRDDLTKLIQVWQKHQILTCATDPDGHVQPLVAVFPTVLAVELQTLASSRDRSLRHWMIDRQPRRVELSSKSCRNANAPEDLS